MPILLFIMNWKMTVGQSKHRSFLTLILNTVINGLVFNLNLLYVNLHNMY